MSESQPNQPINFSSFADWCKHKDSLSESARHTVEVLLEQAGHSACNEADVVLSNLTELYLEDHQITDITPLSGLTNLTYLNLEPSNYRHHSTVRTHQPDLPKSRRKSNY
jgi:hypothetical protein